MTSPNATAQHTNSPHAATPHAATPDGTTRNGTGPYAATPYATTPTAVPDPARALPGLALLGARLTEELGPPARAWLAEALATARTGDTRWELRFAEAGRRTGAEFADAARVLLLATARAELATLIRLYRQGTPAERRAVLKALPHLVAGPGALPLVEDALRTNDTRLLAAALGPYAAAHLQPHDWRHAVLKCLFTGVRVDAVAGLAERARGDAELARMLGDYAAERTAASRPVPADLHHVLALTETATGTATETATPKE